MTVLRSTQQVAQVLLGPSAPDLRVSQQYIEVANAEASPDLRVSQQYIEVLYPNIVIEPLVAAFTGSASLSANLRGIKYLTVAYSSTGAIAADLRIQALTLTAHFIGVGNLFPSLVITSYDQFSVNFSGYCSLSADLLLPSLKVNFLGTGSLDANIQGVRELFCSFTSSGQFAASLLSINYLSIAFTGSGTLVADLRKNVEYFSAGFSSSGSEAVYLNVPWKPGNTLRLQQTATAEKVLSHSVSSTLGLDDDLVLIFGQRSLRASNIITFTQTATVAHTLPTQTASNTLSLTQNLAESRNPKSQLLFTQTAIGVISFIEGVAASNLVAIQSTSLATSVFNKTAVNILSLQQEALYEGIFTDSVSNTLNFGGNAFGVILKTKTYVLLQAPFNFIQTSVILPSPLMDDTENLISNLILHRSMDGTKRTYIKSSNNRVLKYTFRLDRGKGLELQEFFDAYNGADIKLITWEGEVWRVNLMTNPIDFVQTGRYEPHSDKTEVNLEFEGIKLYG